MASKFAVVALDIQTTNFRFAEYNALSATEKVDHICARIESLCQLLDQKEPDADWIINWREYGISDPDSRYVSNETKKYLKEKMQALTAKYPKLTVISGSVATKKDVGPAKAEEVLEKVEQYYQGNKAITTDDLAEGMYHLQKVKELAKKNPDALVVVRNTSYIFSKGTCIGRHDKSMPYLETTSAEPWNSTREDKLNNQMENAIFQPGNKKNPTSIFTLLTTSGDTIEIGIEICREHSLGVLKDEAQAGNILPFFHFVSSFGMTTSLDNIYGEYYVLLDDTRRPQIILNKPASSPSDLPVHLYQCDLLDKMPYLRGPLKPLYPQEKELLTDFSRINEFLDKSIFLDKVEKTKLLNFIYKEFIFALGDGMKLDEFVNRIKSTSQYASLMQTQSNDQSAEQRAFSVYMDELLTKMAKTTSVLSPILNVDVMVANPPETNKLKSPPRPFFPKKPSSPKHSNLNKTVTAKSKTDVLVDEQPVNVPTTRKENTS